MYTAILPVPGYEPQCLSGDPGYEAHHRDPASPPSRLKEAGILLANNQRQHRTSHLSKDVLPLRLAPQPYERRASRQRVAATERRGRNLKRLQGLGT